MGMKLRRPARRSLSIMAGKGRPRIRVLDSDSPPGVESQSLNCQLHKYGGEEE